MSSPVANNVSADHEEKDLYLQRYDVYAHLNNIVSQLLEERPDDPHLYISQKLREWSTHIASSAESASNTLSPFTIKPRSAPPSSASSNNKDETSSMDHSSRGDAASLMSEPHPSPKIRKNTAQYGDQSWIIDNNHSNPVAEQDRAPLFVPEVGSGTVATEEAHPEAVPSHLAPDTSAVAFQILVDSASDEEPEDHSNDTSSPVVVVSSSNPSSVPHTTSASGKYFVPSDPLTDFPLQFQLLQETLRASFAAMYPSSSLQSSLIFSDMPTKIQQQAKREVDFDVLMYACISPVQWPPAAGQSSISSSVMPPAGDSGNNLASLLAAQTSNGGHIHNSQQQQGGDAVSLFSIRDLCFSAAFDIIVGARDPTAAPSILHALDFGTNLQLGHLLLTAISAPRSKWDELLAQGLATMVGRYSRIFDNSMMRKLKYAIMHRMVETMTSLVDEEQRIAMETVVRDAVTKVADRLLDMNLALSEEQPKSPLTILSMPSSYDEDFDSFVSNRITTPQGHRLSHIPVVEVGKLVSLVCRVNNSVDDATILVDELLAFGICDVHHVAALGSLSWRCAVVPPVHSCTVAGFEAKGDVAVMIERAKFVSSLAAKVKAQVELRWMEAIEHGHLQFNLTCPVAAEVLHGVDVSAIAKQFPEAPTDHLQTAVETLAELASGSTTLNRTFFALSCAGIFSTQLSRFVSALLRCTKTQEPIFHLWMCGVAQNIKGGLRAVFNVRQRVDDDGVVDQQQALLDMKLSQEVANVKMDASTSAVLQEAAFYDQLSPIRRTGLSPEDRRELLTPQAWDFVHLGSQFENLTAWQETLEHKVRRFSKAALQIDEVLHLASQSLRRASSIEDHIIKHSIQQQQAGGGGSGSNAKQRLPLALRAITCTADTLVSMLLSCLVVGVPSHSWSTIEHSWALIPNKHDLLRRPLNETAPFVDDLHIDNALPSVVHALDELVHSDKNSGISRSAIDRYLVALASAGVWHSLLRQWHQRLLESITACSASDVEPLWRLLLQTVAMASISRIENLITFGAYDMKTAQTLRWWQTCMTKWEDGIRASLIAVTSTMSQSGSVLQAEHLLNNSQRLVKCFSYLLEVVVTNNVSEHRHLLVEAVEDALQGVTFRHHYAIATVILNQLRSLEGANPTPSLELAPASSCRYLSIVVAHLGRVVELLTSLVLPRIVGLTTVIRHVLIRSTSFASSASASIANKLSEESFKSGNTNVAPPSTLNSGRVSPSSPQKVGMPPPAATHGSGLATASVLPSALRYSEALDWQSVLHSEIAFHVMSNIPHDMAFIRGWYILFASDALRRLAQGLMFEDALMFTGAEFQQSLQHSCFSLMIGGMSTQYFGYFVSALDETLGSRAAKEAHEMLKLLRYVGDLAFQYPSEQDQAAVMHVLPTEVKAVEGITIMLRETIAAKRMELPILLIASTLNWFSPGAFTSHSAVLNEMCRLCVSALLHMTSCAMNMESVTANMEVVRFLSLLSVLTCGGQSFGFTLVGCFGDIVAHLYISSTDQDTLGAWARIMLKVVTFLETKIHTRMMRPMSNGGGKSMLPSHFDEAIDLALFSQAVELLQEKLLGGQVRSVLMCKSFSEYFEDLAHDIFDLMMEDPDTSVSGVYEIDVGLRGSFVDNLEGTTTDVATAAITMLATYRLRGAPKSQFATETVERLILSSTNAIMLALDNEDSRIMREFSHKKKEALSALQSLETADFDGAVPLESSTPIRADVFLKKQLRALVTEAVKSITYFTSQWHIASKREKFSSHSSPQLQMQNTVSSPNGAVMVGNLGSTDEDELDPDDPNSDVPQESLLPPFYYHYALAPTAVTESLALSGLVPRDTNYILLWLKKMMQQPMLSAAAHQSMRMRNRSASIALNSPLTIVSNSTEGYLMIKMVLRGYHQSLRDAAIHAFAATESQPGSRFELAKFIAQNQSLAYINLLKNETQAKTMFATDWQATYIAPSIMGTVFDISDMSAFKLKESSDHTIDFTVLNEVYLDVYYPMSPVYIRSLINTLRFAANGSSDTRKYPLEVVHHVIRSFIAQRASSMHLSTFFTTDELTTLKSLWDKAFGPNAFSRSKILELVSKYSGMVPANTSVAIDLLNTCMSKVVAVLSQPTFVAAMLVFTMEAASEEENLILQVFGSQWGPFVHALLIALKVSGVRNPELKRFAQVFRSMRLVARCCSVIKKSQPLEATFSNLPHRDICGFLRSTDVFQPNPAEPLYKHATLLVDAVRELLLTPSASSSLASSSRGREAVGASLVNSTPLRQWIEESIQSNFTRLQLGAAVRRISETLLRAPTASYAHGEAIRWILVAVYMSVRSEDEVQQRLQLPSTSPANPHTVHVAVQVSAKIRNPPIDPGQREKCMQAMCATTTSRGMKQVATLLLDYIADVLETLHHNLVDAYSLYEPTLRTVLLHSNISFKELQAACVAMIQTIQLQTRATPGFVDSQSLFLAIASLCHGLHSTTYAAVSSAADDAGGKLDAGEGGAASRDGGAGEGTTGTGVVDFPSGELMLFAYSWLRLMPDIMDLYTLALMKYRKLMQERGARSLLDVNDLKSCVLLLHRVAAEINDESKRLTLSAIRLIAADWAMKDLTPKDLARYSSRVIFSCITQAMMEAIDQCESSMAIRELFVCPSLKPAWSKSLWLVFHLAWTAMQQATNADGTRSGSVSQLSSSGNLDPQQRVSAFQNVAEKPRGGSFLISAQANNTTSIAAPIVPVPPTTPSPPPQQSPPALSSTRTFPTTGALNNASPTSASNIVVPQASPPSSPPPVLVASAASPTAFAAKPSAASPSSATTTTATSSARQIAMTEVQRHNTRKDCWIAVDGKVYDVSSLMMSHPGGMPALLGLAGKDGSTSFEVNHDPVGTARGKLTKYYVGDLKQ